jgi:hypothetical protein
MMIMMAIEGEKVMKKMMIFDHNHETWCTSRKEEKNKINNKKRQERQDDTEE